MFQDDNASPHRTAGSRLWLQEHGVPYFSPWPACSPDLTPAIETAWGVAKNILKCGPSLQNRQELKSALQKAWAKATSPRMLSFYAEAFWANVDKCIQDGGGNRFTDYV